AARKDSPSLVKFRKVVEGAEKDLEELRGRLRKEIETAIAQNSNQGNMDALPLLETELAAQASNYKRASDDANAQMEEVKRLEQYSAELEMRQDSLREL